MTGSVGIIGVGNMGGAMACRLRQLDWQVHAVDVEAARIAEAEALGAHACPSARAAADRCRFLIVAVVNATQVQAVLAGPQGALTALGPQHTLLLCPTISPGDASSLCQQVARTGALVLDAPMSGGPARAREGRMSLMLGGPEAMVQHARNLLEALSDTCFHVGPNWGDGAKAKLVNNLLAAINLAGAAEALALAERLGLDAGTVQAVIAASSGASWIGSDRMPRALAGDYEPRAHVSLLRKDSALAMEAAEAVDCAPPLGAVARELFQAAAESGLADRDDAALLLHLRQVLRRARG